MNQPNTPFFELTAADLMTEQIITIPVESSLRTAACLLRDAHVHGAPVVDHEGRVVGVLSVSDLARWAVNQVAPPARQPLTCQHQEKLREAGGRSVSVCLLHEGACPMQHPHRKMDDSVTIACSEPNSVLADWQIVEMETLPEASVKHYMTSGAVVADEDATIGDLAKQMSRYSVHRVVIVDDQQRPVGIVSSTDLIAAIDRSAAFVESTLVPCA